MIRIPLGQWVNHGVDTLLLYFGSAFDTFTDSVTLVTDKMRDGLDL
ncbi:MAG TPA: proline/glycine betaine ABC transporter permease, partial [Desulfitobacterium dehalogenans]|nr:proline/glycine betaine ABC transporter permease [Desulfitobacterium dehalogenans]